jgi:hypothetical protein
MRKIIPALVAIAALAVPATSLANAGHPYTTPGGASAGVQENGWIGDNPGNSAQYSATYTDPVFGGPLTCTGTHLKKQNTDNFTCKLNSGGSWGLTPFVGYSVSWNSDYWGVQDPGGTHNGTMNITSIGTDAAGHVTSYTGVATYTS